MLKIIFKFLLGPGKSKGRQKLITQFYLNDETKHQIALFRTLLKKLRSIVGHFNHSDSKQALLFEKQRQMGLKQSRLVQEVCTRWNSTLAMIKRIVEQRIVLNNTFSESNMYEFIICDSEYKILNETIEVLTPFLVATELLSGSKYVTSSLSLPIYYSIKQHIKVGNNDSLMIKSIKTMLLAGLDVYSNKYDLQNNKLLLGATFLDPKYKQFSKFENKIELFQEAEEFILKLADHTELNTFKNPQIDNLTLNPIDYFSDASATPIIRTITPEMKLNELKNEIFEYKNDPRNDSVLQFWSNNVNKYPLLAQIAQLVLCAPATSVPSECLFSDAGYQIWDRRNKLIPLKVNSMLFLNANYKNKFD